MNIYVVSHKNFKFPNEKIYRPIKVGSSEIEFSSGVSDNHGDNISQLNDTFCEMTALYWIWKNNIINSQDIIGMVHYRRYFKSNKGMIPITENEIDTLLENYDFILPKKRNYYVSTVEAHYSKAHNLKDIYMMKELLQEKEPGYITAYQRLMNSRTICLYNMFITKGVFFNSYCEWAFPLLLELEKRIDRRGYNQYQNRVIGFLAERLFNIWLIKNEQLNIKYLTVYNSEGESFLKKGMLFLRRQYFGNKEKA